MENNEQLEQQIRDLFSQNPKLRTITESFQGNKEFLGNILLTPEEKKSIIDAYKFSQQFPTKYAAIVDSISEALYVQTCSQEHSRLVDELLPDNSISFRNKILNNKSKDCLALVRVYEVVSNIKGKTGPKNILFLNPAQECYKPNTGIRQLLDEMFTRGMFKNIVVSATLKDSLEVLKTGQIHAIYNAGWSSFGPLQDKQQMLNILNANTKWLSNFHKELFEKRFMSIYMNDENSDFYGFFEGLAKGTVTETQGVLFPN